MPIQVPTDVTIVTLRAAGRDLAQRWTEAHARAVFQAAAGLVRSKADILFSLAACESATEEMPAGAQQDAVDEAGYHFLAAAHPAGTGARAILVDRIARREVGGQARHQTRVCLIAYGADVAATGRILAHELAHLLELPHVDEARRPGPGQERAVAAWMRNLMYSGALNPAAELTPEQVRQARASALARRFGSR